MGMTTAQPPSYGGLIPKGVFRGIHAVTGFLTPYAATLGPTAAKERTKPAREITIVPGKEHAASGNAPQILIAGQALHALEKQMASWILADGHAGTRQGGGRTTRLRTDKRFLLHFGGIIKARMAGP